MSTNSEYHYSQEEKDRNKVLANQASQLNELSSSAAHQDERLKVLRAKAEEMLRTKGKGIPQKKMNYQPQAPSFHLDESNIPNWEDLVEEANSNFREDVILEQLLSREDFNFCKEEVERIDADFAAKTSICNKTDMTFLFVATALQTVRWIILNKLMGDIGETINTNSRLDHNDKSIKDEISSSNKSFQDRHFENHGHKESLKGYKSWEQIIFSSAPFDANIGSANFGVNMEGKYHRYKTLGHDPMLGWIFGTANFITDTITLSTFDSYKISRIGGPHFDSQTNLLNIFYETFDSTREDGLRLPAGVFAEYVHLKSDIGTKLGLPVPLLEAFSEELAGKLYRSQYDTLCLMRDAKIIRTQAVLSLLINMIIGLVHGLFYNQEKDGQREHYEIRTRKILSISNTLASAGNVAYCTITKDLHKLDVGGLLVTIKHLFSDIRFITKVKKEYIEKELDKVWRDELTDLDADFD